jgi:hypothetical protein
MRRYLEVIASVCALVLTSVPALAQGQSQSAHGNGSKSGGNGNASGRGNSGTAKSPSQSTLPPTTGAAGPAAATPFAWVDNATLMAPGTVWIGTSLVRWQGDGVSEVSAPVIDVAAAVHRRVQVAMSMPRVHAASDPAAPQGGWGTTFANVKLGLVQAERHGFNVAAAPTLEILSEAAMVGAPAGRSRMQWGLPVSADVERGAARLYGSTGYFSPGVWFAGAGFASQVSKRAGASLSFSRAWNSSASTDPAIDTPKRNELSGGGSFDITPHVSVYGSIGQTIATSPQNGGGRTFSVGMAVTATSTLFRK